MEDTHPDLAFLIYRRWGRKEKSLKQAETLQLKNAVFVDSVGKKEVVDYLSLMDVALVNLRKSDTFKTVIPSKIFEAAAMEKPILLGLEGETKGIIENYNAGVCFRPEDQNSFYEAVNAITGQREIPGNPGRLKKPG